MDPGERRLLATMPLHAITAIHGEAGLRERLPIEIAGFLDADRQQIARALDLAARLHAADRRQREPYLNHLLRVTIRIISHYRVRDADVACAALLHDAVEDHAAGLASDGGQREALAAIAAQLGDRVAELLAAVTNPDYEPGRDTRQQYREHVAASLDTSPLGAGHQDLRLHRQRRRPHPHHRPPTRETHRQIRTAGPGPPRADRPPRHPAG